MPWAPARRPASPPRSSTSKRCLMQFWRNICLCFATPCELTEQSSFQCSEWRGFWHGLACVWRGRGGGGRWKFGEVSTRRASVWHPGRGVCEQLVLRPSWLCFYATGAALLEKGVLLTSLGPVKEKPVSLHSSFSKTSMQWMGHDVQGVGARVRNLGKTGNVSLCTA